MGCLKPIISPFITGYHILQHMFIKFIRLMLFCTFRASTIVTKAIIHIYNTISKTITSIPNAISNWFNKPRIGYTNKRPKTSYGAGKYSNNLCTSKTLLFNERNCKSGRHTWQHMFMKHKSWTKPPRTDTSYPDLKIKSRNLVLSNLHLLEDGTKYFMLSIAVQIVEIIVTTINMFYLTTSQAYVTITYQWSKGVLTGFPLTFPSIVF